MKATLSLTPSKPNPHSRDYIFGEHFRKPHSWKLQRQTPRRFQDNGLAILEASSGFYQWNYRLTDCCHERLADNANWKTLIIPIPTTQIRRIESGNHSGFSNQSRGSTHSPQLDFNTMNVVQGTEQSFDHLIHPNTDMNLFDSCSLLVGELGGGDMFELQSLNSTLSPSSSSVFPSPNLPGSYFASPSFPGSTFISPNPPEFDVPVSDNRFQAPQPLLYSSGHQLSSHTTSFHQGMMSDPEGLLLNSRHYSSWQGSGFIDRDDMGQGQLTRTYECSKCGKSFDPKHGSGNLWRHHKSVHTPKGARDKRLECECCGASFSRMDGKRVHYGRKHPGQDCPTK